MSQLRISYDDQLHDVLDRVNAALAPHGLRFEDDDQVRDGFTVHELKRTAPPCPCVATPPHDRWMEWREVDEAYGPAAAGYAIVSGTGYGGEVYWVNVSFCPWCGVPLKREAG